MQTQRKGPMSNNGTRPKPRLTARDMVAAGTKALSIYAERARKEDLDNPVLSCMAVALLDAIERATADDEQALRLAVGYAMLGAFLYGQEAGRKMERIALRQAIEAKQAEGVYDRNG